MAPEKAEDKRALDKTETADLSFRGYGEVLRAYNG